MTNTFGQVFQATSQVNTGIGVTTKLYGDNGGDDIFNINFQTSSGIVGLNINLQDPNNPFAKFARMAIPNNSSDLAKKYAMDEAQLATDTAIDIVASYGGWSIPLVSNLFGLFSPN
jgi:hypothetical protein